MTFPTDGTANLLILPSNHSEIVLSVPASLRCAHHHAYIK